MGLVTEVTISRSGKIKFRVVGKFDPSVKEVIVGEDNTFIDEDGRWYYQSLEESEEEPTEESVEEPTEESVEPIQEVAVIAPQSTLEVSQDIPDATQAVTLTRDEFMTKWDMRTDTVEGNQAYSKAYDKTKDGGYWTAPDGNTWTRSGNKKQALWTQKPLVIV